MNLTDRTLAADYERWSLGERFIVIAHNPVGTEYGNSTPAAVFALQTFAVVHWQESQEGNAHPPFRQLLANLSPLRLRVSARVILIA